MSSSRRKWLFQPRTRRGLVLRAGVLAVAGTVVFGGAANAVSTVDTSGEPELADITLQAAAAPAVTRAQVIANAKTWHPHTARRVPYSQSKTHGGYRTDCSGYASMTLRLPKSGPNTVGLASSTYSRRLGSMRDLKTGDIVIDAIGSNTTRHVVIFEKWANSAKTAYWAYEQRGGYGTDHRTRSYGLSAGSQFKPYRPRNIR